VLFLISRWDRAETRRPVRIMIFPGMDPYLEEPQIWPGVHSRLVVYIADALQPVLRPRYIAAVEERVFLEGPNREILPDVWLRQRKVKEGATTVLDAEDPVIVRVPELEIRETYVTILDRQSGQRVVTVIEATSPTNKYLGPGRESYLAKQQEVLRSQTHLVEIDLLRTGSHVLAVPEWVARGQGNYDYLVSVNRAHSVRDRYELYLCPLQRRLPRIRIPLAEDDPDVLLDIQAVVQQTYEAGSYVDRLDYRSACRPPLSAETQQWVDQLVRSSSPVPRTPPS
jgi:Protein of unknown function (DUF4058)